MKLMLLSLSLHCWLFALLAGAQEASQPEEPAPTPLPMILQIYREGVKPGKFNQYVSIATAAAQASARFSFPHNYQAIYSITGPSEFWYLNGFDSYEEMEHTGEEIGKNPALANEFNRVLELKQDLVIEPLSLLAQYRDDLSYNPGVRIPRMRYFSVSIDQVYPGHNRDYEDLRRIVRNAHERARTADAHLVYQVISGMQNGTFLVLTPLRSLQDIDEVVQMREQGYPGIVDENERHALTELSASIKSSESYLFAFMPSISHVSSDWIAADPAFWNPKTSNLQEKKPAAKPR